MRYLKVFFILQDDKFYFHLEGGGLLYDPISYNESVSNWQKEEANKLLKQYEHHFKEMHKANYTQFTFLCVESEGQENVVNNKFIMKLDPYKLNLGYYEFS